MAHLKATPVLILALVFNGAGAPASDKARGTFRPVVARQRILYVAQDGDGGGDRVLYEYVGTYLRSSDGSELATLGPPQPGPGVAGEKTARPNFAGAPPVEARLRVGRDGNTYKLDYRKHTATLVTTQPVPLVPHNWEGVNKEDIVGHQNIDGRRCTGILVHSHGDETGTAWRDEKSDILVRLESFFGSKGDQVRVVLDRFDISTRQEPDESLFAIPAKWTVITSAAPAVRGRQPQP